MPEPIFLTFLYRSYYYIATVITELILILLIIAFTWDISSLLLCGICLMLYQDAMNLDYIPKPPKK